MGSTAIFWEQTKKRVVCVGIFALDVDVWCLSWYYRRTRILMTHLQGRDGADDLESGILARDSRDFQSDTS